MPSPRLAEEMYDAWARVTTPSSVLLDILQDEKRARTLYNAMRRQYKFISAERSADDERGEMTIFDKVLVDFWHQGHQLKNTGLLEFFIEEFMMAKSVQTYAEKKAIISAHLRAQEMIDAAFSNPEHLELTEDQLEAIVKEGYTQPESALEKLIHVYQEAKADFYYSDADKSGISNKCNDKFTNVRFLRDTAENLFRHMKANGHDAHPLLPELQKMIDITSRHAEHLAGGRKRIFERPEDEDTRPIKRQRREYPGWRRRDSYRPGDRYEPSYRHQRDDRDDDLGDYRRRHKDDLSVSSRMK